MILFLVSFLLVFVSSYFLTSIISPKKSIIGFIYLFLIAFAQLVLTFEILSLFTAIREVWVLTSNLIIFAVSAFLWNKNSKPIWSLDCKDFIIRVKNSFKLDRALIFLFIAFCIFIVSAIFLCAVMPITSADALAYHCARALFWVTNHNLAHFDTSDIRNLCLPINSEILYTWVLMFIKTDVLFGFFSLVGYLLSIVSVYNILGFLGYCTRKKLWVIFILSSFSSVIVQASGTETDIIIAGLVSSSIFLFWYALKNNKLMPIFMASLAYALAVGTKTPAIFAIPSVGLFLLGLSIYYKRKDFYRPLGYFVGFGIVNFVIFASYNYILNFIHFGNFMGSESFMQVSKNYYGIKGLIANFIQYIFLFFDFTGFKWSDYIGSDISAARELVLKFLHLGGIKEGLYTVESGPNRTLLEPIMGAGILGFLAFLPCAAWAFIKPVFVRKSKKVWFQFAFVSLFIINLLVMSYVLAFMIFSIRFVMFFMVLSSTILVYSYFKNKNPLKYVLVAFSLFYLGAVSTHLWARPINKIMRQLYVKPSISYLRETARCKLYEIDSPYTNSTCILRNKIRENYSKKNKFLVFLNTADNLYIIKSMYFEGYDMDFKNIEDAKKIDFDKYNIIITTNQGQKSTYFTDYEKRKNECTVTKKSIILKKGNTAPCIYVANPKAPKTKDGKDQPPFQVQCIMTRDFHKEKHLEAIGIAGIISAEEKNPSYYIFYYNTNLPLFLNKKQK